MMNIITDDHMICTRSCRSLDSKDQFLTKSPLQQSEHFSSFMIVWQVRMKICPIKRLSWVWMMFLKMILKDALLYNDIKQINVKIEYDLQGDHRFLFIVFVFTAGASNPAPGGPLSCRV